MTRKRARAVFLDRDGVLNRNVFYADTQAYESPRSPDDVVLTDGIAGALSALRAAGYLLILVSNQPNAVKGKCTRATLNHIHDRLLALFAAEDVQFTACYYCYHHPSHSGPCQCRKPSPYFLFEAARSWQLDLSRCWMIGDRASDVACGRAAGAHTVWIDTGEGMQPPARENAPDLAASSVVEVVATLIADSAAVFQGSL